MRAGLVTVLALVALVCVNGDEESRRCAQVKCLASSLPLAMIKDMIKSVKSIIQTWPSAGRRHKRYLPKLYIKKLNTADISKILGVYEDHVFKKMWSQGIEYSERFSHSFYRLRVGVERCKDHGQVEQTRYARKKIKGMEETLKKLHSEELSKAAGDFETILRWISFYIDKKLSHSKCQ